MKEYAIAELPLKHDALDVMATMCMEKLILHKANLRCKTS